MLKIECHAFLNNSNIPAKYTCDGENINSEFNISGVPDSSKSLALIMDDPDAPLGLWVHWILWNINPTIKLIAENSVPKGAVQGKNSFNKNDYGGPCPPDKQHRYFFKLFALDTILNLDENATSEDLYINMEGHILEKAELIGLYDRPRNTIS